MRRLAPYQPGKPIEELERELGISNAIKLASNENPWGPSPLAVAALRETSDQISWYPDASGHVLKEALGKRLKISPTRITLGNGSNDVLDLVARTFVEPGDEVIYSQYAFLVYALVTQAVGGRGVVTPAFDWGHDLAAMADAVTARTKVVFIANPNNPTGTFVGREQLTQFLDGVPSRVLVVLDEAYFEYVTESEYP
ncbi:MAG: aminotransferase class I/II-fold pyridoxal phosphate-dependent enzyme, partial [Gammaproteobacteria bacterium]|nr:aminotransferase class I/II-fold pyridoxal phosphate-dependent enzyme [Gammaproteobacteria bacterium]